MTNLQEINEENLLVESKQVVEELQVSLTARVDPASLTKKSKIPFKIFSLREPLFHRITALSDCAIDLYDADRRIASYLIIRACLETTAATYNLRRKCERFLEEPDIDSFDEYLTNGLIGGRDEGAKHIALNILTMIDKVDTEYNGFRKMYDVLCEYAHPNFFGVLDSYAKFDQTNIWLDLGNEIQKPPPQYGLPAFLMSLKIFIDNYNEIDDVGMRVNEYFEKEAT